MKIISAEVFGAYLNCPTKCWLLAANHPQAGSVYSELIKAENNSYRTAGRERFVANLAKDEFAHLPHMGEHQSGKMALGGQLWNAGARVHHGAGDGQL
jgi:hypothetical protein